jgi:hypothetical protein
MRQIYSTTPRNLIILFSIISSSKFFSQNNLSNLERTKRSTYLKIEFDQDVLNTKMNEDRDYTMGIGFQVGINPKEKDYLINKDRATWRFSDKDENLTFFESVFFEQQLKDNKHQRYNQYSYSLKGMGFTPDSLQTQKIVYSDRPFAGVVTVGFNRSSAIFPNPESIIKQIDDFTFRENSPESSLDLKIHRYKLVGAVIQTSTSTNIGVIGSNFFRNLQGAIHKANDTYKDTVNGHTPFYPYGWKNQISGKGLPTFLKQYSVNILLTRRYFLYTYVKPVNKQGFVDGIIERIPWFDRHVEMSLNIGSSIGYYTGLSSNFQLRFGRINPLNWMNSLNSLNNSNYCAAFQQKKSIVNNFKGLEYFFYVNVGGNFLAYNALLRGQILSDLLEREDIFVLKIKDIRHFFYDLNAGIGISGKKFTLYYAPYVFRSSETWLNSISERKQFWGKIGLFINLSKER